MRLTDEQFRRIDDKVTALLRASKRGTPERERAEAIAAVAHKHGLVGGDA